MQPSSRGGKKSPSRPAAIRRGIEDLEQKHLKSIEQYIRPKGQKEAPDMNETQKTAVKAVHLAATALAAATAALLSTIGDDAPAAGSSPPQAKAATPAPAKAAPAPAEAAAPAKADGDLLAQTKAAALVFANVNGRRALALIIQKYGKTIKDVAADKLPALLADLTGPAKAEDDLIG